MKKTEKNIAEGRKLHASNSPRLGGYLMLIPLFDVDWNKRSQL